MKAEIIMNGYMKKGILTGCYKIWIGIAGSRKCKGIFFSLQKVKGINKCKSQGAERGFKKKRVKIIFASQMYKSSAISKPVQYYNLQL